MSRFFNHKYLLIPVVKIFTKVNYMVMKTMGDSVMDSMFYVRRIRDLREDHDYSQEYVAQYLGTSQTMYARYERAANELPIRHLIKLCELYNVSADYILGLKRKQD